jgi:hypothetical protein
MAIRSWKMPSNVTTFRRQLYAIHKGLLHWGQVRCSGLKVAVNCASGLGVRRAMAVLLFSKQPACPLQPTPAVKKCLPLSLF